MSQKQIEEALEQFHKDFYKKTSESFLTIGELVDLLIELDQSLEVVGVMAEGDSYRGSYDFFYLEKHEYSERNPDPATVGDLVNYLQDDVLGQVFTGYKGGDYTMHVDTPIFLSTYGTSSGFVFLGVKQVGNKVYPILMDSYAAFE